MLKNKTHYVFVAKMDGKFFAYAKTISNSNNLLSYLGDAGLQSVNAADSKKEAAALADFWNDCYKKKEKCLLDVTCLKADTILTL